MPHPSNHLAETATGLPIFSKDFGKSAEFKKTLVLAAHLLAKKQLTEGVSGHISVKDPSGADRFWVNPFGVPFNKLKESDLICVDNNGVIVDGDAKYGRLNPSAFTIHYYLHQQGHNAVVHSHSQNARILGALGQVLLPMDQESAAFYEANGILDDYTGPAINHEHGKAVAEAMQDHIALILKHHGLITVGNSIEEAAFRHISFDSCAALQLRAFSIGSPDIMSKPQAVLAKQGFNESDFNRFSFYTIARELFRDR